MAVTEQERLEETERQAEATADELAERNERLGHEIKQTREGWEQTKSDSSTPTAAGDWEDSEPDDSTGEDPAGFDDPESADLDEEDEDDDDEKE
jgi:hypothetical protein